MIDRTFILDSEHTQAAESRLYGYAVTAEGRLYVDELPPEEPAAGLWCLVRREGDSVTVTQDASGGFGLFLWREGDRWLLSNSLMRLASALDRPVIEPLAALALMDAAQVPCLDGATLLRGVTRLGMHDAVRIRGRELTVERGSFPYYAEPVTDRAALDALDGWFRRWTRVLRQVVAEGAPLACDLTGGLDTRILIAMLRRGNVDVGSLLLRSHEAVNLQKDAEDWRIASAIAAKFGWRLNDESAVPVTVTGSLRPEEAFEAARDSSLGVTQLVKYGLEDCDRPIFTAKGLGSTLKGGFWRSRAAFCRTFLPEGRMLHRSCMTLPERLSSRGPLWEYRRFLLGQIRSMLAFSGLRREKAASLLYKRLCAVRDLHKALDWMCCGRIALCPFTDPAVERLDYTVDGGRDKLALAALVLDRFDPELLEFPVQGRVIRPKTLARVREINRRFPPAPPERMEPLSAAPRPVSARVLDGADMLEFLRQKWDAPAFRAACGAVYDPRLTEKLTAAVTADKLNRRAQPVNALLAVGELAALAEKGSPV